MKDHRKHRVPTERHRRVAEQLSSTDDSIQKVLRDNGYSESTSRLGINGIPKTVLALMPKNSHLVDLGSVTPELQERVVRGRLMFNTLRGSDKGSMSAKVLGSDRRVNMFVPDSQTGLIVLNMPKEVSGMDEEQKKKLIEGDD